MRIDGTTVLVTGANGGIGRAVVGALASRGGHVLAGVRELDAAHEIETRPGVQRVRIDLSSRESIEASVGELGGAEIEILVNNDSIIGHAPFPGATVYAAAKTGLHGFTESLRRELAETDISVLELITPGIDTEMMDQVQRELGGLVNTNGWDHVKPEDWAEQVATAIEDDSDELKPGGPERIAKLLPKALLDRVAGQTFHRRAE